MTGRNVSRSKVRPASRVQGRGAAAKGRGTGAQGRGAAAQERGKAAKGRGAARRAGSPLTNRVTLAGLMLLGLAGAYALAGFGRPVALPVATVAGSPGQLPITSAVLGCSAPGSGGSTGGDVAEANLRTGGGSVTWTAANPPASGSPVVSSDPVKLGQLSVSSWGNGRVKPVKQASLPSMAGGAVPTSLAKGGLIVAATKAYAQGLDVEQLGPDGKPTARCQPPGADFWFVGPASPKLHVQLFLLNVDSVPADAAVSVQTDSGLLISSPDSGIIVPPHGMVMQTLDKLLGPAKAVALHVTTSTGRVVAAVRETTNLAQPGSWLPAAAPSATSQVLTGLPSLKGTLTLYLTVPGDDSAVAHVSVVSRHGTYVPTGGASINLLSRLTSTLPLPSLSGVSGSIKITSTVPIVASVVVAGGQAGSPGAFIAGSAAITEQGVLAATPVGSLGKSELMLSAPGRAASVRITVATPGMPLTGSGSPGQVVQIPANSAVEVPITPPKGAAPKGSRPRGSGSGKASLVAIIITPLPGSGPVYAARLALSESGNTVRAILPVISSPTVVQLPDVRESLLAVLG